MILARLIIIIIIFVAAIIFSFGITNFCLLQSFNDPRGPSLSNTFAIRAPVTKRRAQGARQTLVSHCASAEDLHITWNLIEHPLRVVTKSRGSAVEQKCGHQLVLGLLRQIYNDSWVGRVPRTDSSCVLPNSIALCPPVSF